MERPGAVNKKFKTKFMVTKFFILIKSFCISEIFIPYGITYKTKNSKNFCFMEWPGAVNKKIKTIFYSNQTFLYS